jgi:protein TonB
MIARYAISMSLGTTVTFALLFVMQLLIDTGREAMTDSRNFRITDFVRVERNEIIETREEKPERPPEPETPPEMPTPDPTATLENAVAVSLSVPNVNANLSLHGVGFGISDGEYLPIVKVAPIYPSRAITMDLEGYVIVAFTVTRSGTTRDVVVIESTHPVFDRAAREAASKFKYKPRVIDGEPVEVIGVHHRITFILQDA